MQFELVSPPDDGITTVAFTPGSSSSSSSSTSLLLTSSWDSTVRLHNIHNNSLLNTINTDSPILDVCWDPQLSQPRCYTSNLNGEILSIDLSTNKQLVLGSHSAGARCVAHHSITNSVISAGWDGNINTYDTRTNTLSYSQTHNGFKMFSLSLDSDYTVVVAGSSRKIWGYDVRQMSTPLQIKESLLQHATRCIRMLPKEGLQSTVSTAGYAISSVEGRVGVEYFNPDSSSSSSSSINTAASASYAFKCHRVTDTTTNTQTIYPVNILSFHPLYRTTFASGGCDGSICIWDVSAKKRICQFTGYATSIASLSFSNDGKLMAIASSYTYEQGEKENYQQTKNSVFIRQLNEQEVSLKAKQTGKKEKE